MINPRKQEGARQKTKRDSNGDGVGRDIGLTRKCRVTGSTEQPTVPILDNLTCQLLHHECGAKTGKGSAGKRPRVEMGERKPDSCCFGETEG